MEPQSKGHVMREGLKEIVLGVAAIVIALLSLVNTMACRVATALLYLGLAYVLIWSGSLSMLFSKEAPSTEEFLKEIEEIKKKYGVKEE